MIRRIGSIAIITALAMSYGATAEAYTFKISAPTSTQEYLSSAPMVVTGSYYWTYLDDWYAPTSVMCRVYDAANPASIHHETAGSFTATGYGWTCNTNAPPGLPGPSNQADGFVINAYLYNGQGSSYAAKDVTSAQVKKTGGS